MTREQLQEAVEEARKQCPYFYKPAHDAALAAVEAHPEDEKVLAALHAVEELAIAIVGAADALEELERINEEHPELIPRPPYRPPGVGQA